MDGSRASNVAPWAGWLLGPAAWGADLAIRYALVPSVCDGLSRAWLLAVGAIAAAVAASGAAIAWRCVRRLPDRDRGSAARLLAYGGLGLSSISLLGIAMATIASIGARC